MLKDRSGNISLTLVFLFLIMLLLTSAVGVINNQNNVVFKSNAVLRDRSVLNSLAESSYYKTIHIVASKAYTRTWDGVALSWVFTPDYILTSSDVSVIRTWIENDTKTSLHLSGAVTADVSVYSPSDCTSTLQQFGSTVQETTGVCVKENLTYNGLTLNVVYKIDQITLSSPNNDQNVLTSSQNKMQLISYRYTQ